MREIKFRFWDPFRKVMNNDHRDASIWNGLLVCEGDTIPLQYTGLKDKNGKEIYESDICKSGNGRLWIIKHGYFISSHPLGIHKGYGWYAEPIEEELKTAGNSFLYDGFTIIGNIYENPDLIKNYPEK